MGRVHDEATDREIEENAPADWLDQMAATDINTLAARVIGEDRISSDSLRELLRSTGIAGEEKAGEDHGDGYCPKCGSGNICAQTADDERRPWGCLDCDAQFEDPEKPMFAMVVVVEDESPESAWTGLAKLLEGNEATRYVGAPWKSIPPGTTEFTTDSIMLGMTIPATWLTEPGQHSYVVRDLTPCD